MSLKSQSVLKYDIGTKWTYERVWNGSSRIDFQSFEVTDTLTLDSLSCFIIDDRDTICTIANRVYSKNDNNGLENGLQLLYDFDQDSLFTTQCNANGNGVEDFDIVVDSIVTEVIADGQLVDVHYITNNDIGFVGLSSKIYQGIGSDYGYPFPHIDFCNNLSDPVIYELITLRCFENSTDSYRFIDYACDSIRVTVSTQDIARKPYVLYPNPTDGIVHIAESPTLLQYKVTDIHGSLVSHGAYNENGISIANQGVYYITLYTDEFSWIEKVVRY